MSGHYFCPICLKWSLNCAVFAPAVQIQSLLAGTTIHESHQIVCCNALYFDVIRAESEQIIQLFFLQSMLSASTWNTLGIHLAAVLCPGLHF